MFRWDYHLSRFAGIAAIAVGFLGSLQAQENGQFAPGAMASSAPELESSEGENTQPKFRLREGTVIANQAGHFRHEGEGAVFINDKQNEFIALPNLSLERVTRTLKGFDEPEGVRWTVSGVITEFNGRNYLLINRAVYKSSVPPPAPVQLAN
jgi:hypothetical protein